VSTPPFPEEPPPDQTHFTLPWKLLLVMCHLLWARGQARASKFRPSPTAWVQPNPALPQRPQKPLLTGRSVGVCARKMASVQIPWELA
jgi:hypothetical protein